MNGWKIRGARARARVPSAGSGRARRARGRGRSPRRGSADRRFGARRRPPRTAAVRKREGRRRRRQRAFAEGGILRVRTMFYVKSNVCTPSSRLAAARARAVRCAPRGCARAGGSATRRGHGPQPPPHTRPRSGVARAALLRERGGGGAGGFALRRRRGWRRRRARAAAAGPAGGGARARAAAAAGGPGGRPPAPRPAPSLRPASRGLGESATSSAPAGRAPRPAGPCVWRRRRTPPWSAGRARSRPTCRR